jgi:pimeloyl-ACP methyl ester carboxylesterase
MKEVYFISGLGADERLFQNIRLQDARLHFVKWIVPLTNESWQSYAQRLAVQIPPGKPVLVGLSMGGMMAVEIGKLRETEKIILISSATVFRKFPSFFKLLRYTGLHRWLPYSLWKCIGITIGPWIFGPSGKKERKLLRRIILDTPEKFFRWAWQRIITWNNLYIPPAILHIHGTRDRMLPLSDINPPDTIIEGGTHFMVIHEADKISRFLQQAISQN